MSIVKRIKLLKYRVVLYLHQSKGKKSDCLRDSHLLACDYIVLIIYFKFYSTNKYRNSLLFADNAATQIKGKL